MNSRVIVKQCLLICCLIFTTTPFDIHVNLFVGSIGRVVYMVPVLVLISFVVDITFLSGNGSSPLLRTCMDGRFMVSRNGPGWALGFWTGMLSGRLLRLFGLAWGGLGWA
ncbi:hypothetical protein AMTRI_Chr10g4650 [Amborella trichopoda]